MVCNTRYILFEGPIFVFVLFQTSYKHSGLNHIQVVEIELDDGRYKGMPFVLRRGETWIKNNDSDFYLDFNTKVTKKSKAIVLLLRLCNS